MTLYEPWPEAERERLVGIMKAAPLIGGTKTKKTSPYHNDWNQFDLQRGNIWIRMGRTLQFTIWVRTKQGLFFDQWTEVDGGGPWWNSIRAELPIMEAEISAKCAISGPLPNASGNGELSLVDEKKL